MALRTEVGASQGKSIRGEVGTEACLLPRFKKKSSGWRRALRSENSSRNLTGGRDKPSKTSNEQIMWALGNGRLEDSLVK